MLSRIVSIFKSGTCELNSRNLICKDYLIEDIEAVQYLETNGIIVEPLSPVRGGDIVEINASLVHLNSHGFYESVEAFIKKNRYQYPEKEFYIYDLDWFSTNQSPVPIINIYLHVLKLITAIEENAKYNYSDGFKNAIIVREDKSLFLPLNYNLDSIINISPDCITKINECTSILSLDKTERNLIFCNELIEALKDKEDEERFHYLLINFEAYFEKASNAFQFYLRDFSYNKLKIEIDSKALEYAQKIQSVVSDAQTKLIAIPAAFVLTATTINFNEPSDFKNWAAIIGMIVFSYLIQLFLNNQRSTLGFIENNLRAYKDTFQSIKIDIVSANFQNVILELKDQKRRLGFIEIILWVVPSLLILIWTFSFFTHLAPIFEIVLSYIIRTHIS